MADECTDSANKEQFTICIRWVGSDLQDHENLGLYQVNAIDADMLVHAIRHTLLCMGLSISSCRWQCFDGASNVSSSRSGVSTQIQNEKKRAIYTHSYGHCLNLAVGSTLKQSFDIAYEVSKRIKFSPKRNAALN